jgi:RAC serine/threonine-protein kinase
MIKSNSILDFVGEGTFSCVYKLKTKNKGKSIAVKIFKKNYENGALHELNILNQMNQENIIRLYNEKIQIIGGLNAIFMHYYSFPDLYHFMANNSVLNEETIRIIFNQVCTGLQYAHDQKISHHDIKPDNILIDEKTLDVKIIDWNLSIQTKSNDELVEIYDGSPLYLPLEVLSHRPYNPFLADCWSIGITIYEVSVGKPPFDSDDYETLFNQIIKDDIEYPVNMSKELSELIENILKKNPKERLGTINDIKRSRFF